MNFVRHHWFGLIMSIVVCAFMLMFVLVLLSPRQDAKKRGFIPCTETLAENILSCQKNKVFCLLSAVVKNSWCDAKVIGAGFSMWVGGEQSTPWANYIFEPEIVFDGIDDPEAREQYLKENPNLKTEMIELKRLSEELENEESKEQQLNEEDKPE
ncbi:MAG: hypothetical protein E7018_02125 [Alphaproteobacteria bacterium]|nr:hypothetical protein [Alphaproteobacteria bacterium]